MSCKCQKCGQQFKVDFMIPDNLWEEIKPANKPKGGGLLCGRCIVDALEQKGYGAWELKDLGK